MNWTPIQVKKKIVNMNLLQLKNKEHVHVLDFERKKIDK